MGTSGFQANRSGHSAVIPLKYVRKLSIAHEMVEAVTCLNACTLRSNLESIAFRKYIGLAAQPVPLKDP